MISASEALPGMAVHLRLEARGPVIAEEAVRGRDIAEALSELVFEAGLRNGLPLAVSDLVAQLRPVYRTSSEAGRYCDGFTLETEDAICLFSREILEPAAVRASPRLLDAGKLDTGDLYLYELALEETALGPIDLGDEVMEPEVAPIAPLLACAQRVAGDVRRTLEDEAYAREQEAGSGRPDLTLVRDAVSLVSESAPPSVPASASGHELDYPVFYTRQALAKADRISRKGAAASPPVETGGLLVGRLCWCPESFTLYGVIDDVLEASHSEGTTYSLTFTAETWSRVQAVLKARQRQPGMAGQRILGQCHGHNFLPYDRGETCDGCPSQGSCGLSTAYLSESDRRWCRAVFPRQPWQLSHVFGLTPRREPVSAFYGQRGATLERRGYYVLEPSSADR